MGAHGSTPVLQVAAESRELKLSELLTEQQEALDSEEIAQHNSHTETHEETHTSSH